MPGKACDLINDRLLFTSYRQLTGKIRLTILVALLNFRDAYYCWLQETN